MARVLVRTRVTPNQITWAWGLMMLASSLLLLLNDWVLNIVAGLGWLFGYALDYTDGGIARLKGMRSSRGAFMDLINHSVNYPLLFICAGIGVWRTGGCPWFDILPPEAYIALGVAGGLGCVLIMLMPTLYRRVKPQETVGSSTEIEGEAIGGWFRKMMTFNPLTFTNMMALIVVFAIIDQMWLFVLLYGAGFGLGCVFRFAVLYKRLDRRRQIDSRRLLTDSGTYLETSAFSSPFRRRNTTSRWTNAATAAAAKRRIQPEPRSTARETAQ